MGRTLARIAHEIVEKNPGESQLALVGIHTRGAVLGRRLHALVGELSGTEVPLGDLDISFYRDDIGGREPRDAAGRPRLAPRLRPRRPHRRAGRRRALHRPHGARRDRRALRLRAARRGSSSPCSPTAATASCRSAPTTSARTCRRRRGERVNVRLEEIDGVDEVAITRARPRRRRRRTHEAPARDRGPLTRATSSASSTRAESFAEVGRRDIKKVPTLRGRTIVNLFYEAEHPHQLLASSSPPSASPPTSSASSRPARRSTRASR